MQSGIGSDHLSNLAIDAIAGGLDPPRAARAHSEGCALCRDRIERARLDNRRITADPLYGRTLERIEAIATRRSGRLVPPFVYRWQTLVPIGAMLVVAAIVVPRSLPIEERVKGSPILLIVRDAAARGTSLSPAQFEEGETVSLVVRDVEGRYALVMAVDDTGTISKVWPRDKDEGSQIAVRSLGRLPPSFRVTPGDLTLYGFFSNQPTARAEAEAALRAAMASCVVHSQKSTCFEASELEGNYVVVRTRLDVVEPSPSAARGRP